MPGDIASRTVDAYFEAVRNRDSAALRRLFADDAVLVSTAGVVRGNEAIVRFYEEVAFATEPDPRPGPLLVRGDLVAVEIDLVTNGGRNLVGDFFTLRGDRIRRLAVFLGPAPES